MLLILFTSTTIYLVTSAIYFQYSIASIVTPIRDTNTDVDGTMEKWVVEKSIYLHSCAGTAAVAVNVCSVPCICLLFIIFPDAFVSLQVTLGDAVVCWRAWVVWRRNRAVGALCGVCLLTTFGAPLCPFTNMFRYLM